MSLTRTHNIDIVNNDLEVETLYSSINTGTETVEMGISDPNIIFSMLSDLSSERGRYALRELFSNAYDATLKEHPKNPPAIEITLDASTAPDSLTAKLLDLTETVASLVVTDHGCGMSPDEVRKNFLQYGGSNKRDDIDAIGSKGLGSKAPLAVCESFHVRTVKNGTATSAVITKNQQTNNTATLTTTNVNEPNGTRVTVPVTDNNTLIQMQSALSDIKSHCCEVPISVNGELVEKTLVKEIGSINNDYIYVGKLTIDTDTEPLVIDVWEPMPETKGSTYQRQIDIGGKCFPMTTAPDSNIDVLIGGYAYTIETYYGYKNPILAIDPGWLDFTPSRDEIKRNEVFDEFIKTINQNWKNLDHGPAMAEWIANSDIRIINEIIGQYANAAYMKTRPRYHPYSHPYQERELSDDASELTIWTRNQPACTIPLDHVEKAHPGTTWSLKAENDTKITRWPAVIKFSKDAHNRSETYVNNRRVKQAHLADKLYNGKSGTSTDLDDWVQTFAKSVRAGMNQGLLPIVYVVTDIDEDTSTGVVAKNLPDFYEYIRDTNTTTEKEIVVVPETADARVPLETLSLYEDIVEKITFDELKAAGLETRRKKNRAAAKARKKKREDDAQKKPTDDSWRCDEVAVLRVPDENIGFDRLLSYACGVSIAVGTIDSYQTRYGNRYYHNGVDRIYTQIGELTRICTSSDKPLETAGVIIGNGRDQTTDCAYTWAALIALSRLNGNPIVPDSVKYVVVTKPKQLTQRQAENYVRLGATILEDLRTNVVKRKDTVVNNNPNIEFCQGLNLIMLKNPETFIDKSHIRRMIAHRALRDVTDKRHMNMSDVKTAIYACLQIATNSNDGRTTCDEIIRQINDMVCEPHIDASQIALWTCRNNACPVDSITSRIKIEIPAEYESDYTNYVHATETVIEAMRPITDYFCTKTGIETMNLAPLRDMMGDGLRKKIEKLAVTPSEEERKYA